jgi:lactoylglutathione lyase
MAFDVTDLGGTYNRTLARGPGQSRRPGLSPESGVRMAFVADPEGDLIELLHRPLQHER